MAGATCSGGRSDSEVLEVVVAPGFGVGESRYGSCGTEDTAAAVMSKREEAATVRPSSSRSSEAAFPLRLPEESSMPAGSSGKEREVVGRRGWRVRRV